MSFVLKGHVSATGNTTGAGPTSAIDTSGANLIVLTITYLVNSVFPVDSKSNTYTKAVDTTSSGGDQGVQIWYCFNPTVGSGHTFTVSSGGTGNIYPAMEVSAWSGAITSPLGPTAHALSGTATSIQPGSITPAHDNALIISGCTSQITTSTINVDSGFTITDQDPQVGGTNYGGAQAYLIQGSAAAVNPTWSNFPNNSCASAIAAFYASAVSPSTEGLWFHH